MSLYNSGLILPFEVGDNGNMALGSVNSKTSLLTIVNEEGTDFAAFYHAADAKRLAACWNLLNGYATEELEGVTLAEFVAKHPELAEKALIAAYASLFAERGATNYLEVKGARPELGPFTITLQRTEGLTPVEKLEAMTKQRDALLSSLEWTDEQIIEFIYMAFRHAEVKGDFELSDVRDALNMIKAGAMSNLEGEQS